MNPRPPADRPVTILVVDDDPKVLSLGKEILQALGYQVLVAADGEQAMKVYQAAEPGIDLLIMDYQMPRLDGYQVLQRLRQLNPQVRVLIASGFFGQAAIDRLLAAGAAGLIQKPYRVQELAAQLRKTLE